MRPGRQVDPEALSALHRLPAQPPSPEAEEFLRALELCGFLDPGALNEGVLMELGRLPHALLQLQVRRSRALAIWPCSKCPQHRCRWDSAVLNKPEQLPHVLL